MTLTRLSLCKVSCKEVLGLKDLLSHKHMTHKGVRESYDDEDPESEPRKETATMRPTQWRADRVTKSLEQSIAVHLLLKGIAIEAKHPDLPEGALGPPSNLKQIADFDKEWRLWCGHPSCPQRSFATTGDLIIDKEDGQFRRTFLKTVI